MCCLRLAGVKKFLLHTWHRLQSPPLGFGGSFPGDSVANLLGDNAFPPVLDTGLTGKDAGLVTLVAGGGGGTGSSGSWGKLLLSC